MKTEPQERAGVVTMRGAPLTLLGPDVKVGEKAPDFKVVDAAFKPVQLSDFKGQVVLVSAVPSLDTKVCSIQTKRFNAEAEKLPPDVVILTISQDLPFAQSRFCGTAGIDRVETLSDYRDASFGENYGVLIKEFRLLARAVFVIGADDVVKYVEYVKETTEHPDYEQALAAARTAAG